MVKYEGIEVGDVVEIKGHPEAGRCEVLDITADGEDIVLFSPANDEQIRVGKMHRVAPDMVVVLHRRIKVVAC
jgi:hypothetical protein